MATPMDTSSPRHEAATEHAPEKLLVARRHVCEYGLMPVQSLLPRMDGPAALLSLASRLTERAATDSSGLHRKFGAADAQFLLVALP